MTPVPHGPQAEPLAVLAVGAVVVDRAGRVLLVRRARAPAVGTWTIPGGHVEPGETFEVAIVREIREETGLQARVVCPLGVVGIAREGFYYSIHEHLMVAPDDAPPRPGDDAAEAQWATRGQLEAFGLRADAIDVIDRGLAEAKRRGLTVTDASGARTGR